MSQNRRWCDTNWNYSNDEHSIVDQVYVGLELDSDSSRRISLNFLRNPSICAEFIGSFSAEIFDSRDIDIKVTTSLQHELYEAIHRILKFPLWLFV